MSNKKKNIIKSITIFLIVSLFYNIVWNGYIVNPTDRDAFERETGEQGRITKINKKQSIGIVERPDGYSVYAISDGFLGWSLTDQAHIHTDFDESFVTVKEPLEFNNNIEGEIVLILDWGSNVISYFNAIDEHGNKIIFNTSRAEDGKVLHYSYTETPLVGDIVYEAYSTDDELLYREIR